MLIIQTAVFVHQLSIRVSLPFPFLQCSSFKHTNFITLVNILQKSVAFARERASGAKFFANQILGQILTKTSILMQTCIEDDMVRRNWQNI